MCNQVILTSQQLSDNRADLRAEFQSARRMSNFKAMRQAFKDICLIDEMLREDKCITYYQLS